MRNASSVEAASRSRWPAVGARKSNVAIDRGGGSAIVDTADKAVLACDCRAQRRLASPVAVPWNFGFCSISHKLLDRRYTQPSNLRSFPLSAPVEAAAALLRYAFSAASSAFFFQPYRCSSHGTRLYFQAHAFSCLCWFFARPCVRLGDPRLVWCRL